MKNNKTLVFDLDETLVHTQVLTKANKDAKDGDSESKIADVKISESSTKKAKIFIRPGVHTLLRELRQEGFELILFTAGNKYYMESIVKEVLIDPETGKPFFEHMLSRDEMRVLADLTD